MLLLAGHAVREQQRSKRDICEVQVGRILERHIKRALQHDATVGECEGQRAGERLRERKLGEFCGAIVSSDTPLRLSSARAFIAHMPAWIG